MLGIVVPHRRAVAGTNSMVARHELSRLANVSSGCALVCGRRGIGSTRFVEHRLHLGTPTQASDWRLGVQGKSWRARSS